MLLHGKQNKTNIGKQNQETYLLGFISLTLMSCSPYGSRSLGLVPGPIERYCPGQEQTGFPTTSRVQTCGLLPFCLSAGFYC